MTITVHHLENSRSQRVLWMLEELGLPYAIKRYERNTKTMLAPPELKAVHPLGKSPVIEDDGRTIIESGAIVEWLCLRHGGRALLPDPEDPAYPEHLELMHFAEGSAMLPILLQLYTGRLGDAAAPLRPRIDEQLNAHFDEMERRLRPSGHFVLDRLSAADVMLSFPAEVAHVQGRTATRPKLAAFVNWVHAQPAWRRALEKGGPYAYA